jgi:hypothetical protein
MGSVLVRQQTILYLSRNRSNPDSILSQPLPCTFLSYRLFVENLVAMFSSGVTSEGSTILDRMSCGPDNEGEEVKSQAMAFRGCHCRFLKLFVLTRSTDMERDLLSYCLGVVRLDQIDELARALLPPSQSGTSLAWSASWWW